MKMRIIEEYREVQESIAVCRSRKMTAERKLAKEIAQYQPAGDCNMGIDYSIERVQTSQHQQDIFETAHNIALLNKLIAELNQELQALFQQRDELRKSINMIGDVKKQVIMYRMDGLKVHMIARKLNYSQGHVYRILKEIDDMKKNCDNHATCEKM
ncbi:hypothetical protein [Anaerotalea alkaliphila]|uniref:Uncharacterized protein n=1 Tax=Anaerotalea alkaliphila TaxID=2662126 RepID=A0A7X5HXP2_9FIRM|nr:hypothetical protein [Anaerotalea alkaliphila]NDL68511.1 hypothetical protein [Anaerotalea alkaliphila]